jgi:hypothetical protein
MSLQVASLVPHGATPTPLQRVPHPSSVLNVPGDWGTLVDRMITNVQRAGQSNASPAAQLQQLTEILRVQSDVSRYHLRVELVSKVSESAVASIRKLQQNQ